MAPPKDTNPTLYKRTMRSLVCPKCGQEKPKGVLFCMACFTMDPPLDEGGRVKLEYVHMLMQHEGKLAKPVVRMPVRKVNSYAGTHPEEEPRTRIEQARARARARQMFTRLVAEALRTLPFDSASTEFISEHDAKWRVINHFGKLMGKEHPKAKNRWRQGVGEEMTTPSTSRANLRKDYGHEPQF